jgi:hypothetical protein
MALVNVTLRERHTNIVAFARLLSNAFKKSCSSVYGICIRIEFDIPCQKFMGLTSLKSFVRAIPNYLLLVYV